MLYPVTHSRIPSVLQWLFCEEGVGVGELILKRNDFVFFLVSLMKVSDLTVDSLERN